MPERRQLKSLEVIEDCRARAKYVGIVLNESFTRRPRLRLAA
jgi:hypothetical protein